MTAPRAELPPQLADGTRPVPAEFWNNDPKGTNRQIKNSVSAGFQQAGQICYADENLDPAYRDTPDRTGILRGDSQWRTSDFFTSQSIDKNKLEITMRLPVVAQSDANKYLRTGPAHTTLNWELTSEEPEK